MPEYQNNNDVDIQISGPNNETVLFSSGESKKINFYTDDSRLTFVNDLPYYNRIVRDDVLDLSTQQTVPVSLNTIAICFFCITGSVTAYAQSVNNAPPELRDHTSDDPAFFISAKQRFNQMVVTGSGTCRMVQYKDLS